MEAHAKTWAGLLVLAITCAAGQAGTVDLGSGWQASWDVSLDGSVNVETLLSTDDTLVIKKTATFTQGPEGGVFPSIPIVFRQIAVQAATSIVIDNEVLTNATCVPWMDFHFDLLDDGDAVFDPQATANSGGPAPIGWRIDPFTSAAFAANNVRLDVWGGVVDCNQQWWPGMGTDGGQLWIDVTPGSEPTDYTLFTLKETPTPEPGVLSLLALGGAVLLRRRRCAAGTR